MIKYDKLVDMAKAITDGYENRYKHVAFIIKGSKIRSVGWNKKKTHTRSNRSPYMGTGWNDLHAEIDASIKYGKTDCSGHTLVVIRIRSNGNLGLSKPCVGCTSLIRQLNFRKVFYSTEEQTFSELTLS